MFDACNGNKNTCGWEKRVLYWSFENVVVHRSSDTRHARVQTTAGSSA